MRRIIITKTILNKDISSQVNNLFYYIRLSLCVNLNYADHYIINMNAVTLIYHKKGLAKNSDYY